jgi:hypothetical protein
LKGKDEEESCAQAQQNDDAVLFLLVLRQIAISGE